MKHKLQKILLSMLSSTMIMTVAPIRVFAEDTGQNPSASPDSSDNTGEYEDSYEDSSTQDSSDGTTSTIGIGTPSPSNTPSSTEDSKSNASSSDDDASKSNSKQSDKADTGKEKSSESSESEQSSDKTDGSNENDDSDNQKIGEETVKDISKALNGDVNFELYSQAQKLAEDNIKAGPHLILNVTGMGTVTVTREDGKTTEYRWNESKVLDDGSNASKTASDEQKDEDKDGQSTQLVKEIKDANGNVTGTFTLYPDTYLLGQSVDDLDVDYLKYPEYYISGNDGEKLHIKVEADSQDYIQTSSINKVTTTIANRAQNELVADGKFTSDENDEIINPQKNDKENAISYEYDYTLTSSNDTTLKASFTDINHHTAIKFKKPDLDKDDEDVKKYGELSDDAYATDEKEDSVGSGNAVSPKLLPKKSKLVNFAHIDGYADNGSASVYVVNDDIWSMNFTITDSSDASFNYYRSLATDSWSFNGNVYAAHHYDTEYGYVNGNSVRLVCIDNGSGHPGPRTGWYDFTWRVYDIGNGWMQCDFTATTATSAARWGMYGRQQYTRGSFKFPKPTKDINVSIHKDDQSAEAKAYREKQGLSYAGAVFNVYVNDTNGQFLGTLTTDSNGNANGHYSGLNTSVGQICIQEVTAPRGFLVAPIQYSNGNTDFTFSVKEPPTTGEFEFKKVDTAGSLIPGAQFTVTSAQTGEVVKRFVSDTNTTTISGLIPGQYIIHEDYAPAGYWPAQDVTATVPIEGKNTFSMTDEPIVMYAKKVTKGTNEPVSGATLELYDQTRGMPIERWVTDSNNHKFGTGTLLNGWDGKLQHDSTYLVREIAVPDGWELNTQTVSFKPDDNRAANQMVVTFGNSPLTYGALKVDAKTLKPVAGTVLQLFKYGADVNKDKPLDEWTTTTQTHEFNSKLLKRNQKYFIHEKSATRGYYLPNSDVEFTAEDTGGVLRVINIQETPIEYQIIKVDADDPANYLSGIRLELHDDSLPGDPLVDSWTTDGKPHSLTYTDSTNQTYQKGSNGGIGELVGGHTYYVREVSTIDGYYLNTEKKSFTVPTHLNYSPGTNLKTITFVNKKISVEVAKIDKSTGKYLAGAKMAIQVLKQGATDHNNNSNWETVWRWTTPDTTSRNDAYVLVGSSAMTPVAPYNRNTHLEVGKVYRLIEESAPNGYLYMMDDKGRTNIEFSIPSTWQEAAGKKDADMMSITAYDIPISAYAKKLDADGSGLKGVTMQVIEKSTGKVMDQWVTDGSEHQIRSGHNNGSVILKQGSKNHYILREQVAPTGYFSANDVEFYIPDTFTAAQRQTLISTGRTPLIVIGKNGEQSTVTTVTMVDKSLKWKLIKTDKNGKMLSVENGEPFVFNLYHDTTASTPLMTLRTDDKDYISKGGWNIPTNMLHTGWTYVLKEMSAPKGWKTNAEEIKVTLPNTPYPSTVVKISSTLSSSTTGQDDTILTTVKDDTFKYYMLKKDANGKLLQNYINAKTGKNESFQFDVIANEDMTDSNGKKIAKGTTVATIDTDSAEYKKNGRVDISNKLYWGKEYTIREKAYPFGYYRANDAVFVVGGDGKDTNSITMVDPEIKARFRKDDANGNPLRSRNFQFKIVYNTDDPTGQNRYKKNELLLRFNMGEADNLGYVYFGAKLLENTQYRIIETDCPPSYRKADDLVFSTPKYYGGIVEVPNPSINLK